MLLTFSTFIFVELYQLMYLFLDANRKRCLNTDTSKPDKKLAHSNQGKRVDYKESDTESSDGENISAGML